jgi:proteasome lid subunit RPN8/RPN11
MTDQDQIRIKIKPVKKKTQKRKLPAKIDRNYPDGIAVVFIQQYALESLQKYARTDFDHELGGVLIGKSGKSSRRSFVEIEAYIPASKGISRRASFEFTNEAQQEIHDVMQSQFRDKQILGWFHTHPGYGIFLSSADQFIDDHYFREKYHIAMVMDPSKPDVEVGIFVWDSEDRRVRVPYYLV